VLQAKGAAANAAAAKATPTTLPCLTWMSLPPGGESSERDEHVPFAHSLAFGHVDLLDLPRLRRLDGHLHLHRLEDDARLPLGDTVPHFNFDFPDGTGDVRVDGGHGRDASGDIAPRHRIRARSDRLRSGTQIGTFG